jgi:hypothetical protein
LVAYGVSHYKGGLIFSWQLLFLILGCCTVAWSAVIFFVLPDSPMRATGFTEEEKMMLVERVRHNETGIQNRKYKRYQVIEALTDPFVWCCVALILVGNLVIGGLGVFSNLIISAFGFSVLQTQLLNIAQGGITIIVMLGSAYLAQKTGQTCLIMMVSTYASAHIFIFYASSGVDCGNSSGLSPPSSAQASFLASHQQAPTPAACSSLSTVHSSFSRRAT